MTLLAKLTSFNEGNEDFDLWSSRSKTSGTFFRLLNQIKTLLDLVSGGDVTDLLKDLAGMEIVSPTGGKLKMVNIIVNF